MTIDEAIEVFQADTSETILNLSELRSDELAKWLTELKAYRNYKDLYEQGRADAIDEIKPMLRGLEGSIYWYDRVCEKLDKLKKEQKNEIR